MNNQPQLAHKQIDQALCEKFRGMVTPPSDFINFCIESYCSEEFAEKGIIILREEDKEHIRSLELIEIRKAIQNLGDQLSFSVSGEDSILWKDPNEDIRLIFYISSTACIGEIVFNSSFPPKKSIIVVPGARANLIMYKLRNNPFLKEKIEEGWRFLKFRHLRHLLDSPTLTRKSLDTHLELDPLTESPAQLRLL